MSDEEREDDFLAPEAFVVDFDRDDDDDERDRELEDERVAAGFCARVSVLSSKVATASLPISLRRSASIFSSCLRWSTASFAVLESPAAFAAASSAS